MQKAVRCGALLAALAWPAAAQNFDLVRVADGVYAAIGRPDARLLIGSNAAVIVNENDVVVVDSHYTPSAARALQEEIRKLTTKPIRYVVNTHWHNDHTQGNQAYVNGFPGSIELISHHATREDIQKRAIPSIQESLANMPKQLADAEQRLAQGIDAEGKPLTDPQKAERRAQLDRQKAYLEELKQIQISLPNLTFDRSLILHKETRPIHVLFFGRGHTRGDVVVYLPNEKIVVTGDLLTSGLPFPRDSYPKQWAETLNAVAGLDFTQVIPGHGPVQQGKDHLKLVAEFFADAARATQAALDQGLTLDDAKKRVDEQLAPRYKEKFANYSARVPQIIERAYLEASGKLAD